MQPFRIVTAIVGEPGVIGAADGGAQLGVEIVAPHDVESECGEEHGNVDAFAVHVADVGWRVELGSQSIGKSFAPALGAGEGETIVFLLRCVAQFIGVGNRFAVDGTKRLIGALDLYAAAKFCRQILIEQVGRLEHVTVGVDDLKSISHDLAPFLLITAVIAAPSTDDNRTRRSALPIVVPKPRSKGCA